MAMDWNKVVGRKVKNLDTGKVVTVSSYAEKPSVILSDGSKFAVGSLCDNYEAVEEPLSDKHFTTDTGELTRARVLFFGDVKEALDEYFLEAWEIHHSNLRPEEIKIQTEALQLRIFGKGLL